MVLKLHPYRLSTLLTGLALVGLSGCDRAESPLRPTDAAGYAAAVGESVTGLDFPSSGEGDARFKFTGQALIPMYPATYVWRVNMRKQAGYYSTFFWGPDGAFTGASYYGAHPFPATEPRWASTSHHWALSLDGSDDTHDEGGAPTELGYGEWKTQALRVYDAHGRKVHELYWDLPDTNKVIRYLAWPHYGFPKPKNAALTFGGAPWNPGNQNLAGVLRGLQIYAAGLDSRDLIAEIAEPLSTQSGKGSVWYLNLNPTPDDIQDKSGRGHHPVWAGPGRPKLWKEQEKAPAPDVELTADAASLTGPGIASLKWSSQHATECHSSGAWGGPRPTEGAFETGILSVTGEFVLACSGPGGTATRSVIVEVLPLPIPIPVPLPLPDPDPVVVPVPDPIEIPVPDPKPDPIPDPEPDPEPAPALEFSAAPEAIPYGGGSLLSWSAAHATECEASGDWSGARPASGSFPVQPLSKAKYELTCAGPGGKVSASVAVTVAPPPVPALTLATGADEIESGSSATLEWSSAGATECAASGDWSGTKPLSGSETVGPLAADAAFTLACSGPGGEETRAVNVKVKSVGPPPGGAESGLDFPSNGSGGDDVRFRFKGKSLQPMYPATYVFRVKLRRHAGYYTTFFWGPDGAFTGAGYYGMHPYPEGEPKPASKQHHWEVSVNGNDYVQDANGHGTEVAYDTWVTQAARVSDEGNYKLHEFFYDLPDTTKVIRAIVYGDYAPPPDPALTFGDAPWSIGNERLGGVLRGIQTYSAALSGADILHELAKPRATAAGNGSLWYLNLDPTPSDISDKSGNGHHPEWAGPSRPAAWTGPVP